MKKILIVFGTRPEAIKMAPLVHKFKGCSDIETKVCITAQHREMLDQVLDLFDIKPDYDLNIMKKGQTLFDVTSNVLIKLEAVLDDFKPDTVFVHGDTSTSFVAALAAFYKQIDVAHIEAGLRTNNLKSPWPEEGNRQLTGRLTNYHFAPTKKSRDNLLKENILEENIYVTGNTVIDALFWVKYKFNSKVEEDLIKNFLKGKGFEVGSRDYILVTGHRRENFGDGFLSICKALKSIAELYKDIDIVYPVHLNPNVKEVVHSELNGISNIYLIEPLEYKYFTYLMMNSKIVLTDSGGIQEEAPSLGKPVLVMRDTTERPEAVDAGTVKLVGTDTKAIVSNISELLNNQAVYNKMSMAHNPYGDGTACDKILDVVLRN